jgi:hypothetical protein
MFSSATTNYGNSKVLVENNDKACSIGCIDRGESRISGTGNATSEKGHTRRGRSPEKNLKNKVLICVFLTSGNKIPRLS